jgi:hypothetical protein
LNEPVLIRPFMPMAGSFSLLVSVVISGSPLQEKNITASRMAAINILIFIFFPLYLKY